MTLKILKKEKRKLTLPIKSYICVNILLLLVRCLFRLTNLKPQRYKPIFKYLYQLDFFNQAQKRIIMEKLEKGNLNLEPIYTFLAEDTTPTDFAKLLDEFMHSYILLLIRAQEKENEDLHEHMYEFFFYFKLLRDILPLCDKK